MDAEVERVRMTTNQRLRIPTAAGTVIFSWGKKKKKKSAPVVVTAEAATMMFE